MTPERKSAYDRLCRILAPAIPDDGYDLCPDAPLWPWIFQLADANFVLPELHQALLDKGLEDRVPEVMLATLTEVSRLMASRMARLLAQMREVNAALAADGIRPVWLKGAALLTERAGLRHPRLMSDLDLWIPTREGQEHTLDLLAKLGYSPKPASAYQDWSESHHYAPLFHPKHPVSLEVHRHLVRKVFSALLPDAPALERAETGEVQGLPIARLSWRDRIMQSLIQCSLMSTPPIETGQIRLMKVVDLARLLARHERHNLPTEMTETLTKSQWRKPLARFLTLLERDFGISNPLQEDRLYCRAVDYLLLRNRPAPRIVLRTVVRPPSNWRRAILDPRRWPKALVSRLSVLAVSERLSQAPHGSE